jgi:hypothetical protein
LVNHPQQEPVERDRRIRKPPARLQDFICRKTGPSGDRVPKSFREAITGRNATDWKEAINEEINNMLSNKTWEMVDRPKQQKVIHSMWTFVVKKNEQGKTVRFKARLVALGNTQTAGVDYDKTHAPVVHKKTLRTLLALAAEQKWEVHHMDITAAYLVADIDQAVFMELPEGFQEQGAGKVCKLKKSLYGLHQSGRLWNEHLNRFLLSKGFTRCKSDPCVYFIPNRELIVAIYVDDNFIFGVRAEIDWIKSCISKEFKSKDLGEVTNLLSTRITKTSEGFELDQEELAVELLKEFNMQDSKGISTPLALGTKLRKTTPGKGLSAEYAAKYRSGIGTLLYLASTTRPDLSFTATYLSQFRVDPSTEHWVALKHTLRYLKATSGYRLRYRRTRKKMELYTDADWGSDVTDRRSFSGGVCILGGGATSWYCRKQSCVSLSTSEAELIALGELSREATWYRNFMKEIGQERYLHSPITLKMDNQGAIYLAENHTTSERSKHIDLKALKVREQIQGGDQRLEYIETKRNIADQLTKIVTSIKQTNHLYSMGVGPDPDS